MHTPVRLLVLLSCFASGSLTLSADLAPGCVEMNGTIRCIERQGRPTPKWQQHRNQLTAMNANCQQWLQIYQKEPTEKNRLYRQMACERANQKRKELKPEDIVREVLNNP